LTRNRFPREMLREMIQLLPPCGFILLRLNTLGQRKLPIVISLSKMLCFGLVCASPCALNISAALQGAYSGTFPLMLWTLVIRILAELRKHSMMSRFLEYL